MILYDHYRTAVDSLRSNRARTGLTTLGIVIGVASVVFVLTLAGGVQNTLSSQINKLNDNIALVKPGFSDGSGFSLSAVQSPITTTLTENDVSSIQRQPYVEVAAPIMVLAGITKSSDTQTSSAPIIATENTFIDLLGLEMRSGEFLTETTSRDTTVLGERLAVELFGTNQASGQTIDIKGRPHLVVGTVKDTNQKINVLGLDVDRAVYVNFDNGKSFNRGLANVQQILLSYNTSDDLSDSESNLALTGLLTKNHNDQQDFTVISGQQIASASSSFFNNIVAVTTIISLVTLVVAGIGIMNIMLVGVTERTREIGVRKALGATKRQIVAQFLAEALIMCTVGGIVGVLLAYVLAFFTGLLLSFTPELSWQIVVIGLSMSFAVGLLFGIYPAARGATKDPIEALKHP